MPSAGLCIHAEGSFITAAYLGYFCSLGGAVVEDGQCPAADEKTYLQRCDLPVERFMELVNKEFSYSDSIQQIMTAYLEFCYSNVVPIAEYIVEHQEVNT